MRRLTTRSIGPWRNVGRIWPRHVHRGRPLNSVVRLHVMKRIPWLWMLALVISTLVAAKPPDAPSIGEAYYKCEDPKMLSGGIFGKGPRIKLPKWTEIKRAEFKALAEQWFSYDWSKEILWWRENRPEVNGKG